MTKLSKKTWGIIHDFELNVKDRSNLEYQKYSLEDLKFSDAEIGFRDDKNQYRLAMRSRIEELETIEKMRISKRRYALGTILVIAGLVLSILSIIVMVIISK